MDRKPVVANSRHRVLFRTIAQPPPKPSKLSIAKDLLAVTQSAVTIIALILAGLWFSGQRSSTPRIRPELRISSRADPASTEGGHLLAIEVWATNIGQTPLYLSRGRIRIDDVIHGKSLIPACWFDGDTHSGVCERSELPRPKLGFIDRLRANPFIGWLLRPSASAWVEATEAHQFWAGVIRLPKAIQVIQATINIETLTGEWTNLTTVFDVGSDNSQKTELTPKVGTS